MRAGREDPAGDDAVDKRHHRDKTPHLRVAGFILASFYKAMPEGNDFIRLIGNRKLRGVYL